ncbi:MAG: gliding motility-associated protein GldE [Flavobacteriales bacterium TMED191]|nr:MAG: gliding motility-associated protein GldE [Flavobacteriales bacterium TMED191]
MPILESEVFSYSFLTPLISCIVLLVFSGLISGSEIGFFALSPTDKSQLKDSNIKRHKLILRLIESPKMLLATILIANNIINITIIIISSLIFTNYLNLNSPALNFFIQILLTTFLILLFGEVIPKTYANRNPLLVSELMAIPLVFIQKTLYPACNLLVKSTNLINENIHKKSSLSLQNLTTAVNLTSDTEEEEKKFLEGIIQFGQTDVKQIMKARIDIVALNINTSFDEVINVILESGYSRIPVYENDIDQIKGILYIKDLLPNFDVKNFDWKNVIREPFFVPESKKIDDLLKEIKERKIHLVVVVDEYGGTSGIVTLEDILEEIVGDISDEFDQEDIIYSKLDNNTYIFDGKTSLNDFYRVFNIDGKEFEKNKGESDTLAGFLLEKIEKIPEEGQSIQFQKFKFIIEKINKKRIVSIKTLLSK